MGISAVNQSNSILGNYTTPSLLLQNSNAGAVTYQNNESVFSSLQNKNVAADGKDDGSIGFFDAIKNFGKGIGKLFTGMFCDQDGNISLAQIAKTGLTIGAITLATMLPVVGPLVLPTLCIGGMLHGGFTFLNGLSTALSAKTDAEAEQAWQDMGTGTTEGVISYIGYKATGGIKQGWAQAKAEYSSLAKSTTSVEPKLLDTPKTESVAETPAAPKAEPVAETPAAPKAEPVAETPATPKAEPVAETPATPKAEPVAETPAAPKAEPVAETPATPKAEPVAETPAAPKAEPVAETPAAPKAEPVAETPATPKVETTTNIKDMSVDELIDLRKSCYDKINNATTSEQKDMFIHELSEINTQIRQLKLENIYNNAEVKPINSEFKSEIYEGTAIPEHHAANGHCHTIRNEFQSGNLSESTLEYINEMDKEFAQLPPTQKDLTVFRSEGRGFLSSQQSHAQMMDNAKVGDVIVPDDAYSYAAFDKNVWGHYGYSEGEGFLYEIRVPKGAKISRNFEHACNGGEALFPRGAQYKVLNKNVATNGDTYFVLEYILPS